MSSSIEAKIHSILLDIDPLNRDDEEQSIIIAEAAENYRLAHKLSNTKKASKQTEEAEIIDCLLQAMNTLSENSSEKIAVASYNDFVTNNDEFNYEAILKNVRLSSNDKEFGDMDIIGDEDYDVFFGNDKVDDLFVTEDIYEDRHSSDLYNVPGYGKHRSDSLAR